MQSGCYWCGRGNNTKYCCDRGKPAVQQKTTDDDQIGSEKARTGKDRLVGQHDEVIQAE